MTSLERDIYVNLTGPEDNDMNGVAAKLNAAYASGGAEMALMTVNKLLNMNIDYYMQMNMQGLVDLVNAVGGITVTNNFDFPISIAENEPDYTATVEPGTHKINGDQALVYARMRYDDPEGDYGRQKRQREVIQKVMKKILSLDSVASYRKILSAVSKNMQTNIEINSSTIPSLLGYSDALSNIKSYQLKGDGQEINGVSYQIVSNDHLLKIQNTIKKALGKKTSRLLPQRLSLMKITMVCHRQVIARIITNPMVLTMVMIQVEELRPIITTVVKTPTVPIQIQERQAVPTLVRPMTLAHKTLTTIMGSKKTLRISSEFFLLLSEFFDMLKSCVDFC